MAFSLWAKQEREISGSLYPLSHGEGLRIQHMSFGQTQFSPKQWELRVRKSEVKSFSRVRLFATPQTVAYRLLCPWDSPGNSTGVDCHSLLQGIFPTWGSNPGLPNCRQTLYRLSHQESPFSKKDPVNSNVSPLFSPCSDIQVFLILRRDIVLYYTGNS